MDPKAMSKQEIQELSRKFYDEFCTISEHLQSEKLLRSYFEKDKEFSEPRGPAHEYCWNRTQTRIDQFTSQLQNLKEKLNQLADVYDSRYEPKTWRQWDDL